MILETKRLILRELTADDYAALCTLLQDQAVMYAYEHAFSDVEVKEWLDRQLLRYRTDGLGLLAVILKETGAFIGQAGLTMQDCAGKQVLEIGYLLKKAYWHQGYAIESAAACKAYAFDTLKKNEVYSIIRDNNIASQKVAKRNGMSVVERIVKHYYAMDMPHDVFCVQNE